MNRPAFLDGVARQRKFEHLEKGGVFFVDTLQAYLHACIEESVFIEEGTTVYPHVFLSGETHIGKRCTIYPGVTLHNVIVSDDCTIEQGTKITDSSLGCNVTVECNARISLSSIGEGSCIDALSQIKSSVVAPHCRIGPFVHVDCVTLLSNCEVGTGAFIDDHSLIGPRCVIARAQIRRSSLGEGTHAEHDCYVGDATIGKRCNIAAGVVFCNYDGSKKVKIILEDDVFVGSGSMLVAPLRIGECAYVAAGSVVTQDISSHVLVVARGQRHTHTPSQGFVSHLPPEDCVQKLNCVTRDERGWHIGKQKADAF